MLDSSSPPSDSAAPREPTDTLGGSTESLETHFNIEDTSDVTPPLSDHIIQRSLSLATLATQYQLHVHPFVCILPTNYDELLALISSAPDTLVRAVRCITFPDSANLPVPEIQRTLPDLQAAVLLVHAHYGYGKSDTARILLHTACRHMLDLKWNLLDADPPTLSISEEELEPIRRVWWECWTLEIKLGFVTGIPLQVLDCAFTVHYPKSVGDHANPASQNLKQRSISLALNCSNLPHCTGEMLDARVSALTNIGANMIAISRQTWTRSAHSTLCDTPEEMVNREEAFEALITSCAAVTYAHMAAYSSCIIVGGIDSTKSVPPMSVPTVRQASRAVFSLLRDSLTCASTPHSPFTNIPELISAYGSFMTIDGGEWARAAVVSDLQLGEMFMRQQAQRWPVANDFADKLNSLSFELIGGFESRNVQLMLGIS
ncbi:hypothetical protein HWV62_16564 [Athelia sp. TMB]|nr:hypothetical protein HWV62_16564 [Athelia sp. TMB]